LGNCFAVIDDGLKNRVTDEAHDVLELQHRNKKLFMPPTTVRFDAARPVEMRVPTAILANYYIDNFFDRIFMGCLVFVKPYGQVEVLGSMPNVLTSYLNLVEMI
jgi:hypothetical protein